MKTSLYLPRFPSWFDMRVFYVRISNIEVDFFSPEHLTLNHIPLGLDTILEVNGGKSSAYSDCASTKLRRDRFDKTSEEVTFINTDNVRITGSIRFEVYNSDNLLLSGVLELCGGNSVNEEGNDLCKKWDIKCRTHSSTERCFLKGKQYTTSEMFLPTIEVYVAGCFSGSPIILTKTLYIGMVKNHSRKDVMEQISEIDLSKMEKVYPLETLQALKDDQFSIQSSQISMKSDVLDYIYAGANCEEEENAGELSWFNAGVRVGVGIGLGICLGVGLGAGILIRSYQATTKVLKKKIL